MNLGKTTTVENTMARREMVAPCRFFSVWDKLDGVIFNSVDELYSWVGRFDAFNRSD